LVDPSSENIYYFNEIDNATSWDRPAEKPAHARDDKNEAAISDASPEDAGSERLKRDEKKQLTHEHDVLVKDAPRLPDGWVELVDPTNGQPYYFHEADNRTSWEHPGDQSGSNSKLESGNEGMASQANRASAALGFGGILCSLLVEDDETTKVMITQTSTIALEKSVAKLEDERRRCNITSPFNLSDESAVLNYVESKTRDEKEDLLWKLIAIAAKSSGRLRSDEGVMDNSSPESSIVKLLLEDNGAGHIINGKGHSTIIQERDGKFPVFRLTYHFSTI
jgi:hypothetical protein